MLSFQMLINRFCGVFLVCRGDIVRLRLSVLEIRRLRDCAEREMHAGHWGSSDIIIPEYDYLYRTLQSAEDMLEMRIPYVRILVGWLAEATGYGSVLLREDESILRKLDSALAEFQNDVAPEHHFLRTTVSGVLRDIHRLQGRDVPDEPSNPFRPDPMPPRETIITPVHEADARRAPRRSLIAMFRDIVRRITIRCKEIISGTPEPDVEKKLDAADAASYLKRTGKAVRALRKKGGW
jgi:hypothetical protein